MNLSWLEDFLALAASGNFSRAAEERHMTQPAFSRRIRALEEWLGVVLIDRGSHPATLTDTGEWFRTVAQEILARVARVPDEARAVADASSATLRLASTHALSFTFLPSWLRSLESHTTVGPVQLVSDVLQQCETLLLQGRVQFVLSHWHERVPGRLDPAAYRSVRVGSDTLLPVSAPGPGGAPLHRLSPPGQARVPVLAYSAESGIGRVVRAMRGALLDQAQAEPVFTAHLASVLKTMALDGRGIAWLPASLIRDELDAGRLLEAGGSEWAVEVEIRLFRGQAALPRAAEALWSAAAQLSCRASPAHA
ncbi:LysR family transcriptional regulator [Aquincola sp. MAHUQ-54]|uniref:LysR family transcriptional regulator n=1 Tax=Aquincola agrisoli TaxID=3119538 RepID=A0AAW9PXL8_9BURK